MLELDIFLTHSDKKTHDLVREVAVECLLEETTAATTAAAAATPTTAATAAAAVAAAAVAAAAGTGKRLAQKPLKFNN